MTTKSNLYLHSTKISASKYCCGKLGNKADSKTRTDYVKVYLICFPYAQIHGYTPLKFIQRSEIFLPILSH